LTITISGIRNPASIRQSSGFVVSTYYRSTDSSLVATGTISGITATTASISNSFVTVTPSSTVVNEISTTYSLKYTVNQPIPSGGYFIIFIPSEIGIDVASLPNSCSVNLNSTSFTSTPCTVLAVTGGY
jgi:hypothetical protein